MSDLHCAATVVVLPAEQLAVRLAVLRDENVAVVHAPTTERAPAERAAERLGCAARMDDRLRAAAGSGAELVRSIRGVLDDLADLHRGETVVVLTGPAAAASRVRIDADGWSCAAWP